MNLAAFSLKIVPVKELDVSIPDRMGIYALSIKDGREIISRLGFEDGVSPLLEMDSFAHLYTGESIGVRSRILDHLAGNVRASNLRKTLLAMQVEEEALEFGLKFQHLRDAEAWLTEWVSRRALVSFKNCPFACDAEAEVLAATASPLNLRGKRKTVFSQRLTTIRTRLSERDWVRRGLKQLAPARRYRR